MVRSFIDQVVNQGRVERALSYVTYDFTVHDPGQPPMRGPGLLWFLRRLRAAFPDFTLNIEELVAEGDSVVVVGSQTGTQQGEYRGLAPAGKAFDVRTHVLYRFRGSSISEAVHVFDRLQMLEQLRSDS